MKTLCAVLITLSILLMAGPGQDPVSTPSVVEWTQSQFLSEITAASVACRPVVLPARVVLTDTVDLKRLSGLEFRGSGRMFAYPTGTANDVPFATTKIIWRGPADKAMFRSAGIGVMWDSVSFVFEQPAFCGVHIVNAVGIAGGGKHVFESCSFIQNPAHKQRTDAIVCGIGENNAHCDALVIRSCIAIDCLSLLKTHNASSVGHMLSGNHTVRCGAVIDAQGGGKVSVFGHASVGDACVLRFVRVGSNVNYFEIRGLSVDSQAPGAFTLIDNALNRNTAVVVTGKLSGFASRPRSDLICNDRPTFDLSGLAGVR